MAESTGSEHMLTKEDVDQYAMLYPILDALLTEFKELSKKKQDGSLNEMKVKMVNRVLAKVKTLLANSPTLEFLDLLDDVKLPSNSDTVLIIAQFKAAMDQYKKANSFWKSNGWVWNIYKDTK